MHDKLPFITVYLLSIMSTTNNIGNVPVFTTLRSDNEGRGHVKNIEALQARLINVLVPLFFNCIAQVQQQGLSYRVES